MLRAALDPLIRTTMINGDCRAVLPTLAADSIDMVLTDPPYFLDGLDGGWRKGGKDSPRATGSIGGLPVGMKFDPKQGRALQLFMEEVGRGLIRVLKPGGFTLAFSQPRLAHRMAAGLEDAGFEIRDLIAWHFTGKSQFKAFSQDHFVRRMAMSVTEQDALITSMAGRRTPQLRPQFEAIILAQRPREGTFVDNWRRFRTGLMDANQSLNGGSPANVMAVEKADKSEKGVGNDHLTPKPLRLLDHLVRLFSEEGQTVLDPFMGSGSTGVAALQAGRGAIGIELNPDYAAMAGGRMRDASEP